MCQFFDSVDLSGFPREYINTLIILNITLLARLMLFV